MPQDAMAWHDGSVDDVDASMPPWQEWAALERLPEPATMVTCRPVVVPVDDITAAVAGWLAEAGDSDAATA